jgi:arabinogalactan oligomer/maltooligosaccharide transport system permease protein
MSKPIITYTLLTAFMGPWTDYIFAKVIMGSDTEYYTIAIGLWTMLEKEYIEYYYTQFYAGCVLISIPIAILFMLTQSCYVEGVSGAVKG